MLLFSTLFPHFSFKALTLSILIRIFLVLLFRIQDWYRVSETYRAHDVQWALQTKAVLDRLQLVLADRCQHYFRLLQPSASYLGQSLRVDKHGVF